MKTKTRWKRKYPSIIGKRFFDAGEYGLGYFTVIKAWQCKVYIKILSDVNSHWYSKNMILIKTSDGLKFKIPFCPWLDVVDAETGKLWRTYYDQEPW